MFIDPSVQVIPSLVTTWAIEDHTSLQCGPKMVLDAIPSEQFRGNKPLDQITARKTIRKRVIGKLAHAYW